MIQLNDPIIELFKSFSLEWLKLFKIPEMKTNKEMVNPCLNINNWEKITK